MKILTAEQMGQVDRLTTETCGLPSLILMENAGMQLFRTLSDSFENLSELSVSILCGKGNNGGDGLVLARQLAQHGISPLVFLLGSIQQVKGDARVNLDALLHWDVPVVEVTSEKSWSRHVETVHQCDIVVDALLGTGMKKPLRGLYQTVVRDLNSGPSFVLSVDIPSGMFSDSLERPELCVQADVTVTFTAPKRAHILNPGQESIGDLHIVPIGTPATLLEKKEYFLNLLTAHDVESFLSPRPACSHKGHYGHVSLIAGSRDKSGAARLAAAAALQAGSGLVSAFVPDIAQPLVAASHPELMTRGFAATLNGTFAAAACAPLLRELKELDAAGIGPGVSTESATIEFVHTVVQESPIPLVVDADALNAFEGRLDSLKNQLRLPLILTPHPGEFSRLTGVPTSELLVRQLELTRDFAQKHQLWVVLKTFRTVIAVPDGTLWVSPLGNPGMASAGMGDVLTGILTSMLGQCAARESLDTHQVTLAVLAGVLLHGMAGDIAAQKRSEESLKAGDVIEALGDAYSVFHGEFQDQAECP